MTVRSVVPTVVPTEMNYSRMLCLIFPMMKVHRILRHCFKGVSSLVRTAWEFDDLSQLSCNVHLLDPGKRLPTCNRS